MRSGRHRAPPAGATRSSVAARPARLEGRAPHRARSALGAFCIGRAPHRAGWPALALRAAVPTVPSMARYDDVKQDIAATQRRWLVTGGAGFIGSHLVEALLALGQSVRVLDNLATGTRENVDAAARAAPARVEFIEGDVADASTCARACADVDIVLHQAALGSVPRSVADPLNSHRANVDGFIAM